MAIQPRLPWPSIAGGEGHTQLPMTCAAQEHCGPGHPEHHVDRSRRAFGSPHVQRGSFVTHDGSGRNASTVASTTTGLEINPVDGFQRRQPGILIAGLG